METQYLMAYLTILFEIVKFIALLIIGISFFISIITIILVWISRRGSDELDTDKEDQ